MDALRHTSRTSSATRASTCSSVLIERNSLNVSKDDRSLPWRAGFQEVQCYNGIKVVVRDVRQTSCRRTYASCLSSRACPTSRNDDVHVQGLEYADYYWQCLPALRTSRLSNFALNADHVFVVSQSSLPQQQVDMFVGSGECAREKSDKATVRSSIVAVALRRLLGESGVSGRECRGMSEAL